MVVCKDMATVVWLMGKVPSIRWEAGTTLNTVGLDALPTIRKVFVWIPSLPQDLDKTLGRVSRLNPGVLRGGFGGSMRGYGNRKGPDLLCW